MSATPTIAWLFAGRSGGVFDASGEKLDKNDRTGNISRNDRSGVRKPSIFSDKDNMNEEREEGDFIITIMFL